ADDGLAGAVRQNDASAAAAGVAAGVKDVGRLTLIVANHKGEPATRELPQMQRQSVALGVAGNVLGRIADGDQRLLEHAAVRRIHAEADVIEAVAEIVADLGLSGQLFQKRDFAADETERRRTLLGFL